MKHLKQQFFKYVSLNILGMLGISCYILADTFFVANGVGSLALAALNIALPVYAVFSGLGQMIAVGAATRYTILKAQGEEHQADRIFTDAVRLSLLLGILFTLALLFFGTPISRLLGADDNTVEMTATYLRTMMIFAPFFVMEYLLSAFVRNDGAPGLSMAAMIAGSLFNVLFDYILIYPMNLGLWGAALATGISPVIGFAINMIHVFRKKNHFHLVSGLIGSIHLSSLTTSCRLGVSSLIAEVSNGIVLLAYNQLMLPLAGNDGIAAYGVVANIAIVVISIFNGITLGMQPLVSDCYGRKNRQDTHRLIRYSILLASVIAIIITAAAFPSADFLVALFNEEKNASLAAIATPGIRIYFTGFLFAGINLVISAAFAATEQAGKAFCISIGRGLVVIVPAAFLLSRLFGLTGLWLSFPVTEVIVACYALLSLVRERRKRNSK